MVKSYQICIPNTYHDFFDYYAEGMQPCIGARVWVPFRSKTCLGVVVAVCEAEAVSAKLKSIISIVDEKPLLSADILALCHWISQYYHASLSKVIPLALPKNYRCGDIAQLATSSYYQLSMPPEHAHQRLSKKSSRQHMLIDFFANQSAPVSKKTIFAAGFSTAILNALLAINVVGVLNKIDKPVQLIETPDKALSLNAEQSLVVHAVCEQLSSYHAFLLQGVTGSGKTEVYLQIIAQVLASGRQVLVLVPEIGLTPQLLARFTARFREPIAIIHSHLNDNERQQAWQLAYEDEVKLVIGTRSAVFTPMPALGLIVIDEEHDASLKQMEGVRYHARDTALMRAFTAKVPIILGSATPSLESLHNGALKKYTLLRLNQKALSSAPLHYTIVDLRNQKLQQGLASITIATIRQHLKQQNQVLVFINRRGFSPVLLCHQCGWMADCHRCDSHLTLHHSVRRLLCHHCGCTKELPDTCPSCKSGELLPVGVGTQRVHDYLSKQFPDHVCVRIDRDEVRKKQALQKRLAEINSGEAQLIIGTQMLAKGHHFPRLTLVVVLEADNGFYNQDFRAMESLGQLLTQVAGRAGRAQFPGQVLIQTHLPQHPLLNTLIQQGYDVFAQALLSLRQKASLPPYSFMAVLRVQGVNESALLHFLQEVKKQLDTDLVKVLGPAPAPLARKADLHRMQLLLKSSSRQRLHTVLVQMCAWLTVNKPNQKVRWSIDVDPINLS
jgi:primosomal protein N' (replication factor Y) (superfamily II helicase)